MTPADSLHAVADAAAMAERIRGGEYFASWHEFYLLAGTAAVTLVGLLFVSLSFHLDVLIHDKRAHLLAHARSTLLSFIYVMIVSLMFLIPQQNARLLGISLTVASGIVLGILVTQLVRARGSASSQHETFLRRRTRLLMVGYTLAFLNSVAMVVLRVPELAFNFIGVICMLLGNAAGTAWDLLVELGKLKAEQRGASEGG